jgi:hypothetical protein
MMRIQAYAGVILMALLSGCQTMTPTECKMTNWGERGQQDAFAGQAERILTYADDCASQQVPLQQIHIAAYRSGYQQGLGYYCQPQRIIEQALDGKGSVEICPIASQQTLRPLYQTAKRVYDARQDLKQLNQEQQRLEQELNNPKTSDVRRQEIRQRLRKLDADGIDARDELRRAEQALSRIR